MAASEPRQQRSRESRESLLHAAAAVLSRRGYAGATYRAIAEESGFSRGLLHFHFKSKQQLCIEVTRWAFKRWALRFAAALEAQDEGSKLSRLLVAHRDLVMQDRPLVRLALQLRFDPSDEAARIREILSQLDKSTSGAAIAAEFFGVADGSLREQLAHRGVWLLACLRGLEQRAALDAPTQELYGAYASLERDLERLLALDRSAGAA